MNAANVDAAYALINHYAQPETQAWQAENFFYLVSNEETLDAVSPKIVDEAGLEGAAATAMMMRLTAIVREPEPVRVEVDRPFLFLVRHRDSGALYFLARITDPS